MHPYVVQRSLRLLFNSMVKALGEWKVGSAGISCDCMCFCLMNTITSVQAGVTHGKLLTTDIANLILEYRYDIIHAGMSCKEGMMMNAIYVSVQVY